MIYVNNDSSYILIVVYSVLDCSFDLDFGDVEPINWNNYKPFKIEVTPRIETKYYNRFAVQPLQSMPALYKYRTTYFLSRDFAVESHFKAI